MKPSGLIKQPVELNENDLSQLEASYDELMNAHPCRQADANLMNWAVENGGDLLHSLKAAHRQIEALRQIVAGWRCRW